MRVITARRTALAPLLVWILAIGCANSRPETVESSTSGFDNSSWARVLELYQRDGGINYTGLAADRADLDVYLGLLEHADPTDWDEAEALAFWSNAYNAVVAEFVLALYPDIGSVKDVSGFFDGTRRVVAGESLTLDEIEGRGRDIGDPRVHFAVVCASTSCPDLPEEPFEASRIDAQLQGLTQRFLADPTKGMRYDEEENVVWLSSIFKWYAGDFTGGSTMVAFFARGQVLGWVLPNLPLDLQDTLVQREPKVRYLDYDWSLNDR